jgi:glutaminyl-peptide cyclotransferase
MRLVEEQVAMGPRVPGTPAHDELARRLESEARRCAHEVTVQEFPVPFRGHILLCRNIVAVFRSAAGSPGGAPTGAPLLLASHYDTRIRADREPDPTRREHPIPGANDGGSGTAVLLHMLPQLAEGVTRDVAVAFLDAEDLGNIDGKQFAIGAAWLAAHPVGGFLPREAVVLDMVGGAGMILDVDAKIFDHEPSRTLTASLFRTGAARGLRPFTADKPRKVKGIISDQTPFALRGVATCLLIDIDYPEWHTQSDLPAAMAGESMAAIEEALWLSLLPRPE